MQKLRRVIDALLGGLLALLMGAAVVNVVWQVFSRFVLRDPSSFTEELARFLLIWIGLLGAAYASGQRMHLAIDLVPQSLAPAGRARLERVIWCAILLFATAVMIWGGSRLVWMTLYLDQSSAALQVKLGYVYLALPISGVLMVFYAVAEVFQERQGDR